MSSKQPPLDGDPPRPAPSSGRKRFFTAVCAAASAYILVGILGKCFTFVTGPRVDVDSVPWGPRQEDGRVVNCANLTSDLQTGDPGIPFPPAYVSTNSFYLPASSNRIFLFSRGSYGHGTVRVELSDLPDYRIGIEVITRYRTPAGQYRANVFHLDQDTNGQGVGIYTPSRPYNIPPSLKDQITFNVTIRLPKSGSPTNPLVINSLETNMGIWRHNIGSLGDHVVFRTLSISGSNTDIHADSVSAESILFKTSNGQISGSYNVSDSLTLKTSNAAILVKLRMENQNGHNPTRVDMKTSNARIESPITLIATDESSSPAPASFSVVAKTSNSPLTISFVDAPTSPFSHLNLDAKTSNAVAHTKLHPTYEGSIYLKTSLFKPSLVEQPIPADPSGNGRHRKLSVHRVLKGALDARVSWGDNENEGKGTVFVATSNAHNTLELN